MTREAQAHEERPQDAPRRRRAGGKILRGKSGVASRRARPRLSRRPRHQPATQLKFRLGYAAAEQYALKEHLGAAKIPVEDMVEAGSSSPAKISPVPYDRFRDRVMFPISDWRGRVIAFGGRALDKDVAAKYLNSPETPLFHKGATLYNIAAARKAQRMTGWPRDRGRRLCRRHRHGHRGISRQQSRRSARRLPPTSSRLMWRMADEPILCFDGDDAGRRAAYRALDLALPLIKPGKSLKFAALPDGQDPDDLVRSGGREAVDDVLMPRSARRHAVAARERGRAASHAGAARRSRGAAFEVTGTIGDETVRRYYRAGFCRAAARTVCAGRHRPRRGHGATSGAGRAPPVAPAPRPLRPDQGYMAASPHLAASPLHRGHRAAIPRARGVDPASRAQSSLAAARPHGGIGGGRVPPRRH